MTGDVDPVGNICIYIYFCDSPYTGWMQYSLANLLSPEGELILTDGSMSVFDSYGSPDIRYTSFWWVDISGAPDSYLHNDVSYSYGHLTR